MHPDSPIRQLDQVIYRYGVSSVTLVPFQGGGYCVELHASGGIHVSEGAGSLPEAIGKAFLKLMELKGLPSFDDLLEASSLGTPEAKALRASVSKETVDRILKHTHENPAVHWKHGATSSCGLVRTGGTHARFTSVLEDVTCRRCRHSAWYRSEVVAKRARRS
jgi:hypothetical protein